MSDISKHKECLKNICRLCRKRIKIYKGYTKKKECTKFKSEILDIFTYDIANDDSSKHPEYICHRCRRTMLSYQKSCFLVFPVDMAEFNEHNIDNCNVCLKKSLGKHVFTLQSSGVLT